MPLPQKRLIPGILLLLAIVALAAPPLWWGTANPPVIDPAAAENNHGPANIGQAKHMAKSALDALRPVLPAVADQIEADLAPIVNLTIPPDPKPADWAEKQKAPLLIGQLKAIADPFYSRLHAAAPAWLEAERIENQTNHPDSIFPWTAETTDDANKAIANIGQLKAVFSLRFDSDSDDDGLLDAWELDNFGDLSQDASGDYDLDGIPNIFEHKHDTDPNDDQSKLGFDEIQGGDYKYFVVNPALNAETDFGKTTILSAISAANDFDVIEVRPGVYPQVIGTISDRLYIFSTSGARRTIVDCKGFSNTAFTLQSESVISGITFSGIDSESLNPAEDAFVVSISDDQDKPRFLGCRFIRNSVGDQAGVIQIQAGSPVFISCTIAGNSANNGSAIHNASGNNLIRLVNTLLWNPGTSDEIGGFPAACTFDHSLTRNNVSGNVFIDAEDQLTANPGLNYDFSLAPGSVARDAGTTSLYANPDLDGETLTDGSKDIGADEYTDTDGDGFSDHIERSSGWDPIDPSDHPYDRSQDYGPMVTAVDDALCLPMGVLDSQSGGSPEGIQFRIFSDFAKWKMIVDPSGASGATHRIEMPSAGEEASEEINLLDNSIYEVTLEWLETLEGPGQNQNWYCWEAQIGEQPGVTTHEDIYSQQPPDDESPKPGDRIEGEAVSFSVDSWIVANIDGLFTKEVHLNDNRGGNVVESGDYKAYLIPTTKQSWSNSYNGGDAVGPRYRKVGLNGRPVPDEKPEQESETDSYKEETYVDAFDLSLRHDTSLVYVPVPASDLTLEVNMSSRETGWSDRGGLRPSEELTMPFGVSWSSNLCAYLEVVESVGSVVTDPITVNVLDESGRSQRFATMDQITFTPWPSGRVDKKTYLNTLSKNGNTFTMVKKHGSTLTYMECNAWFMYMDDRVEGSSGSRKHTYYRLVNVVDRYGKSLTYDYGNSMVSLIPESITSSSGEKITIARSADCKRVDMIIAPDNEVTRFDYTASHTGGADGFPFQQLTQVTYPDGTTQSYEYDLFPEEEISDGKTTNHFHCNIDKITDKRGFSYEFNYVPDESKFNYRADGDNGGMHEFAASIDSLPADVKTEAETELDKMNSMDEAPPQGNQESYDRVYGLPMRIEYVHLPDGSSSQFIRSGATYFGPDPSGQASTIVIDALQNTTSYEFGDTSFEVVDIDAQSASSTSTELMLYYDSLEITHSTGEMERFEFRGPGFTLTSHSDFSGNVTLWKYDDGTGQAQESYLPNQPNRAVWSDPLQKIDALGRSEEYEYGALRIMSRIDDVYGTETIYGIDPLTGNRTSKIVKDASGIKLSEESYGYTSANHKAFMTEKRVVMFENRSGQTWEQDLVTEYVPNDEGRIWKEIVDPGVLALTTTYLYDEMGNKKSVTDPRLVTDPLLNTTHFDYDDLNRLIRITYPSAGTRNGEAVTTKEIWYDRNGNKAAEIDEEDNFTIHHYDEFNRRIATIRDMDEEGLPEQNAHGLVEAANCGAVTGNDLVTRMEYDAVGNAIRAVDPMGTVTRKFYDEIGRPEHAFTGLTVAESASLASATTAAANSTEKTHTEFFYETLKNTGATAFDSGGFKPTKVIRRAATLTAKDVVVNGEVTSISETVDLHTTAEYDAVYRPLTSSTEYESGQFATTTTRYGDGTIAAVKEARETTVTDDLGKITYTVMDGLMRPTTVTDAFNNTELASTTQTFYSSAGLVWKTIDPLWRVSETEYDGAARPVVSWMPDPITGLIDRTTPNDPLLGSPRTETIYDENGNITDSINPLGYTWEYEYDARNRKTLEIQPSVIETIIVAGVPQQGTTAQNPVIETAYDGVGNVISVMDARGNTVRSFHDNAYRVIASLSNPVTGNPSTDPLNPGADDIKTQTVFDANGNPLEIIDGNGNATRNSYDLLNRHQPRRRPAERATRPAEGNRHRCFQPI